jgi:SprT-like family
MIKTKTSTKDRARKKATKKAEKFLLEEYKFFNKKYFYNRLPLNMRIMIMRGEGLKASKKESLVLGSYVDAKERVVQIDKGKKIFHNGPLILLRVNFPNVLIYSTLLHEMAHISVRSKFPRAYGHGPRFHKEMLRLAKLGAFNTIW